MKTRSALIFFLLLTTFTCLAVELRVVTYNIKANMDFSGSFPVITEALNTPGTDDYDSVKRILTRINADVVCLQEIADADILGGNNSDVHSLAADLGLPYLHIPISSGVFDSSLQNVILSRYPISNPEDIGSADYMDTIGSLGPPPIEGGSAARAKDVTRVMPAVTIDVPGVADPVTIINLHAKSGTGPSNRFRRAVEFDRVGQYLSNYSLNSDDKIIVLGDFNLNQTDSNDSFASTPTSGMPSTWNKGTELPFPITYFTDPDDYWPTPYMLVTLPAQDLNGGIATFQSGSTLDFIVNSPALTELGTEIYRSDLDVDNTEGLSKSGNPLNPTAGIDPFEDDSATASDHYAVFADFDLDEQEYTFTTPTETITENFDSFDGADDPVNWTSTPSGNWNGIDDGASASKGNYAYGTTENSLGIITNSSTSFTSQYRNNTGSAIHALQVSYNAEQWRSLAGGAADTWSVDLIIDEIPTTLAPLTFTSDTTGSVTPGTATPLSAFVTNLAIPNGEAFQLRFTANAGAGAGTPVDEVFINEFHYDNTGSDTGEFVEVVIAPGFTGTPSDLDLLFYNGDNGNTYAPHSVPLSDFTEGATINDYTIYSFFESGIQNGAPDGLAIIDTRTNDVLQFISYEGSFMAISGPAAGITSTDIGISQTSSTLVGEGSLGLTGTGSAEADFTWDEFTGQAHTPGQLNTGQSFVAPGLPAQGIAIDNVTVTLIVDLVTPEITNITVNLAAQTATLTFTGAAGVSDWQVMGSNNPELAFSDDRTPASFTESPVGTYTADLDLTGAGPSYFLRVIRP